MRALLTLLCVCSAATAVAQPLLNDGFNVDLYQGPVLGSSRVIGLGGAYAAIAEEAVGIQFNPASAAHRPWYSVGRWDWDLTADWLIPNVGQSRTFSFDNSSIEAETASFAVINVGGLIRYRDFGLGAYYQIQLIERDFAPLTTGGTSRRISFEFNTVHVCLGYGLFDHQVVPAVGVRVGSLSLKDPEAGNEDLFELAATGFEAGVLIRPRRLPLRLGATFYSELNQDKRTEVVVPQLALPHGVVLPWQVRVGVAWELSRKVMNPTPVYDRPPSKPASSTPASGPAGSAATVPASGPTMPASGPASGLAAGATPRPDLTTAWALAADRRRRGGYYLLLTADVVVAAPVDYAVGIASFLSGVREDSGTGYAVSVHLGAEAEVMRRRLRVRVGSYYEPSRFAGTKSRVHGTLGLDLRLFDFRFLGPRSLRIGLVGDGARDYSNAGVSLGLWH